MYNGLSFEQAPPISVVLRFFLSVPVFGIALSIVLLLLSSDLLVPSHPFSVAAIHLFFLGIVTMSMLGALFQMQSVLGGNPIPSPQGNALLIHTFFSVGVISLAGAFLTQAPPLFIIAAVFLGSSLVYTVFLVLPLLLRTSVNDTLRGMRFSLSSLFVAAMLGIAMASAFANGEFSPHHDTLRVLHYSFALAGWIAMMIIAVAFQVVEMFYVTASYSHWCKRNAFRIIFLSLLLKALWLYAGWPYVWGFDLVIAAMLSGFAVTTSKRILQRKRRVSDVSIRLWISGVILLASAIVSYMGYLWNSDLLFLQTALISFGLFSLAIILGMIGKIVPFLVWFHLNSAGYMDAPVMANVIPHKRLRLQFELFALSAALSLASPFYPHLLAGVGIFSLALFVLLGYNLLAALRLYRHILRNGTRFSFE